MLKEIITKLDDIPWARTGLPYGQEKGIPDSFLKENHSYDRIIHKELFNDIVTFIFSDEIKQLNIFNERALNTLLKLVKYFPLRDLDTLGIITWLASLAEMTRIYKIQGLDLAKSNQYRSDYSLISVFTEYFIKQLKVKAASYIKNKST
jgi:hypothetical protein